MRLDRNLNLVVEVSTAKGDVFVHATPLSREAFQQHWRVLAKAFADIYSEGLNIVAGPRIARLMLEDAAKSLGLWEGPSGVQSLLLPEIHRITNVVFPSEGGGYTTLPLHDAAQRHVLDQEDLDEVEGLVCFFICASAMHRKGEVAEVLRGMTSLWGARLVSSNSTEFVASLRTSTGTGTSPPPAGSPVPS